MPPKVNNVQIEDATWIHEILAYIVDGKCPRDKSEGQKLKSRAARYCIFRGAVISNVFFKTFV